MSITKHTPGPLHANGRRIFNAEGKEVGRATSAAEVGGEVGAALNRELADAQLWAEAPALLAALKHIAGHWEAAEQESNEAFALDMASCETCKQLALTAIARAEGRA